MSNIVIEPVKDKRGVMEFVRFPFKLYRGDPNWVPPLIEERRDYFDPRKNPLYEHSRSQLFLARRENELVGTVGAVVNDRHNEVHGERAGGFGFFECIDDQAVADALLDAAEAWCRAEGMTCMRGPLNFSLNDEAGLLIDGFDDPPMLMMTYNPRYYPALIEGHGYTKTMDMYAWMSDIEQGLKNAPEKLFRVAHKAMEKHGIRVRNIDMKNLEHDIVLFKEAYNNAWQDNWGFVPMTDAEIDHLVNGLKRFIDPALMFIAETSDGKPAGVSLTMPDLHQALHASGGGRMWPFGLLRFLWHRRKINRIRLIAMGMIQAYRGRGIDAIFYLETLKVGLAKGYKQIEGSWILESNTMMNQIIERLGGIRYKTYRVYEKPL